MADGDFTIKILGTSRVEGGGFTTTGIAKNNKVMVWGACDYTYNSLGLSVNAADLGLTTLDAIFFGSVQANNDTVPVEATPFSATYNATSGNNGLVLINTNASTQAEATDSQDGTFNFIALGNNAAAPDLT